MRKGLLTPREAVVRLTNACNAKCMMCGIWEEERNSQIDIFLLEKLPKSLRTISLTGGEPFLRNDLPEVIQRAKSVCNKARIVIPTNGISTDVITEQIKKIIKIDPRIAIRLSIDGIGDTHDNIRGVKNAYLNAMKTLESLKKLKIRDLEIVITVTNDNIREIKNVYGLAKAENVKFSCQVIHSSDFYFRKMQDRINQKGLFKAEISEVISSELKMFNLRRLFRAYYFRGLWDYVCDMPRPYPCSAGSLFFYLGQGGDVYPCIFLNKKMGNLRDDSFNALWNSKQASEARDNAQNCTLNCWITCTAAADIKNHPSRAARWVFINKLNAHLGRKCLL